MMKLLAFSLVLFVAAVAPLAFGQGLPQVAPTCEKQLDFVRLYAQELSNQRNRVEGELVQTRVQSADLQKEIDGLKAKVHEMEKAAGVKKDGPKVAKP